MEGPPDSLVGAVLCGKYTLEGVLGRGGMATVYKARHRTGNTVAIKVLLPHLAAREDVRARFAKEAYTANNIGHPGTVKVLDDDVDGLPFFVMEMLHGETLDAWGKRLGRPPVEEVVAMIHEVLDVLVAAHGKGIIHRDLKPENIFRLSGGGIKVLDFGVARAVYDSSAQSRTRTGGLLGSPAFMPPEQARGKVAEIDGRTDLWAVGATAFTLLTGRLVHEEDTLEMLHVASATRHAPLLRSVAPEVPAPIAAVFDRALAFDRNDRWAGARAMQRNLGDAFLDVYGRTLSGVASAADEEPNTIAQPRPSGDVALPSSGGSVAYGVTQTDEAPPGSGTASGRGSGVDPVSAPAPASASTSVVHESTGPGLGRTIDPGESPAPRRAPRWPLAVGGLVAAASLVAAVAITRGQSSGASPSQRPQAPAPLASASAQPEPSPSASTVATGATPDSTATTGATPGSTATTAPGKPEASVTTKPGAPTGQGKVRKPGVGGNLAEKPHQVTPAKPVPTAPPPTGAPNHL